MRKPLLASSEKVVGVEAGTIVEGGAQGQDDGSGVGGASAAELKLLLSPACVPLPRLIDDAFTMLGGSEEEGVNQDGEEDECLLLPCANGLVFDILAQRISGDAPAAAVRQIVSRLDLALNHNDPPASNAELQEASEEDTAAWEMEALLMTTGLRLAAGACLNLVVASASSSSSNPLSSRRAHGALSDVFRRPFLLRLACPISSKGSGVAKPAVSTITARFPNSVAAVGKGEMVVEAAAGAMDGTGGRGTPRALSLGEVACTDMAAMVVAAASAEGEAGGGGGLVADATAPFLERLCR